MNFKKHAMQFLKSIGPSQVLQLASIVINDETGAYGGLSTKFYNFFESRAPQEFENLTDDEFYHIAEVTYELLDARLEKALRF